MEKEKTLPHFELMGTIMQCCFELEWKRLQLQDAVAEETVEESVPF